MHLPFCENLCLFCACNVSIQKDKSVAIPYLAALKHEIDHVAEGFEKAAGDSIPLGRRHADVPLRLRRWKTFSATRASDFRSRRTPRSESKSTRASRAVRTWKLCGGWDSTA